MLVRARLVRLGLASGSGSGAGSSRSRSPTASDRSWAADGQGSASPLSQAGPRPPGQRPRNNAPSAPSQNSWTTGSGASRGSTSSAPVMIPMIPMKRLSSPALMALRLTSTSERAIASVPPAPTAEPATLRSSSRLSARFSVCDIRIDEIARDRDHVGLTEDRRRHEQGGRERDQRRDDPRERPPVTGDSEEVVEDEAQQHDPDVAQAGGQPQLPGLLVDLDQTLAVAVADVAERDQLHHGAREGEHRRPDRRSGRQPADPGLPLELGLVGGRGQVLGASSSGGGWVERGG